MKRLLLLCRGAALHGSRNLDGCLNLIRDTGIDVEVQSPASVGEMWAAIRAAPGTADAVAIGGGDGTINAALKPLLATGLPLGIVPLGTANDFARTLGIPQDLEAACSILASQHLRRIDVAWANDRPFVNAAGIGMSADLHRVLSRDAKRRLGAWSYPAAVLRTFHDHRPFRATLTTGSNVQHIRSIQITVGNGVYYGGGTPIAEGSAIDDGRLDLYSVQSLPYHRLAAVALAVRRGIQNRLPTGVLTASGRAFEVTTHKPMTVSLDGEPALRTPVRFRVEPRCLSVLTPGD